MKSLLISALFLALAGVASAQGTDSCTTPTVITGVGPFAFNNGAATAGIEGQTESLCYQFSTTTVDNDVWFTWNAPYTGVVNIDTCGIAGGIDTKVAAYAGLTCPTAGSALACNDDSGCLNFASTTGTFAVTMGLDYVIQIGTYPGATGGSGMFAITNFGAPPANDDCAFATVITGAGPFPFANGAATMGTQGQSESLCLQFGYTNVDKDVWFTWNATFTGFAQVDTCGIAGGVDTKVAAYPGNVCPTAGSALGCNDDSGCAALASTTGPFAVTMGQDYMIQIGVYPGGTGGGSGMFAINVATPPPSNDDCSTPITLPGPGTFAFDTTYASTGSQGQGVTTGCYSSVKRDLWYTYTGTTNGTITVTTCGGLTASPEQDSKIAIYAGAGCPAGTGIACNDDDFSCGSSGVNSTVSFPSTCGTTYTFQVGNFFTTAPFVVGTFDVTEVGSACATAFTPYCSGDGSDTTCPCTNPGLAGRGCDNTFATGGALLTSSGIASVASPTLVLNSTFAVPFGPGLYYEGNATALPGPNFGAAFGNGLRCAGGATNRLEIRFADGVGAANSTVDLQAFGAALSGVTYYYQQWYRDTGNVGTCTPGAGFNLSNAISLTWVP